MAVVKSQNLTPLVTSDEPSLGPADAPVVVVQFGDYQCTYCGRAYTILQELADNFAGDVRFVYRHFPISALHPQAQLAAEAAEAAAAQGKFWEMHHLLYMNQHALELEQLVEYAESLGLDVARFRADLTERRFAAEVESDFQSGIASGVTGTPTFYVNGVRYDGPWDTESLAREIEKPLGTRVRLLAQQFTGIAASGGIVLLIATIIALLWANSPWSASYVDFWHTHLDIALGSRVLSYSLEHWVNDGLMVLFFFVVGLEIKRELTVGELASPQRAVLPIVAGFGGAIFPVAIYLLFNRIGPGQDGWGIPMATDIAFTLAVLAALGSRIPLSLKVFLTATAIVDDIIAVLVIAVFYSTGISWISLGVAGIIFLVLLALNRLRIYSLLPYCVLGIGLWLAFLQSGVHPTIAGVLLAITIPTRSPANLHVLLTQVASLLRTIEIPEQWRRDVGLEGRQQAEVGVLEAIVNRLQSPSQHLEHVLHPWTTYVVLPIFALANAGVHITGEAVGDLLNPIGLGIVLGLVLGKPIGIVLFAWLSVRLRLAVRPPGVSWPLLIGAGTLAGIGFTISLFIANAATFPDASTQDAAKLAILMASVLAAVIGVTFVLLTTRRLAFNEASHLEAAEAQ